MQNFTPNGVKYAQYIFAFGHLNSSFLVFRLRNGSNFWHWNSGNFGIFNWWKDYLCYHKSVLQFHINYDWKWHYFKTIKCSLIFHVEMFVKDIFGQPIHLYFHFPLKKTAFTSTTTTFWTIIIANPCPSQALSLLSPVPLFE